MDAAIAGTDNFVYATGAVRALHAKGNHAIGYVDAGDAEDYRPDFQQYVNFNAACSGCLIGNPYAGFTNEYMLNINNDQGQADFIRKMIQARTDRVAANSFDAVEYDVVSNFENHSGFKITYETQVKFNVSLTEIAHADGLSAPLKSDVDQAKDRALQKAFDFVIDEQCWQYDQCQDYAAWQSAGKSILNVEYKLKPSEFCPQANAMNFNSIKKSGTYNLYDNPWEPCR